MIIVDDFLKDYDAAKEFSLRANYEDIVNPVDGVVYPQICSDVPPELYADIIYALSATLGRPPLINYCFLRRSPEGIPVPHKFHTDNSMGANSLMIYLDTRESAGTGFAKHLRTGFISATDNENETFEISKDCNDAEKWEIYDKAEMKENRAVIFDSSFFHVALPIGGYGSNSDARTVITAFFD